jgi:hypothetical protein
VRIILRLSQGFTRESHARFMKKKTGLPRPLSTVTDPVGNRVDLFWDLVEGSKEHDEFCRLFGEVRPSWEHAEFSEEELDAADWLSLEVGWICGYPQPRAGEMGFLDATFDLSDNCRKCGVGGVQKAPYRMKAEPRWGRHGFTQLHWAFDDYFVKPEIWEAVFKPIGVGCMRVHDTRAKKELTTVVQLELPVASRGMKPGPLTVLHCPECGRDKFEPFMRGMYPPLAKGVKGEIVKTREWFGSGGRAFRRALVSQDLRRRIAALKLKEVGFIPLENRR